MTKMTATEARIRFGQLLRRVSEDRETVVVERAGEPQVVVLPLAEYEELSRLRRTGQGWETLLDEAIESFDRDVAGREPPPAGDVIRAMREARDAELVDLR